MAFATAGVPDSTAGIEKCVPVFAVAERQLEDTEPPLYVRGGIPGERISKSAQRAATAA